MAKKIKNPVEVKVVKVDGVHEASVHYGLTSEEYPEIAIRKGMPVTLKPQTINDIYEEVMEQINAHEGTLES